MKSLSSIDFHFLESELQSIVGAKIDKIFTLEKESVVLTLHKTGVGKVLLTCAVGKALYVAKEKPSMEEPSGFCMLMRKHLSGAFIDSLVQLKPERLIHLTCHKKDTTYHLYTEFFGGGNVILCDSKNVILGALTQHTFKDRTVRAKRTYEYPASDVDLFTVKASDVSSLLQVSPRESLVKFLALDLSMGGHYAEYILSQTDLDKNAVPKEISDPDTVAQTLVKTIKNILESQTTPTLYKKKEEYVQALPLDFGTGEKESALSFSEALETCFSQEQKKITTSVDGKIAALQRIIESQEKNIKKLQKEEQDNKEKAEHLYSNYQMISSLLSELKVIEKKHSWQDIKKTLKGHAVIKDVNASKKEIVIEL